MSSCHSRAATCALTTPGSASARSVELVIVGGEERLRAAALVRGQILGDRPRDAEAVERGGAAADLVEHDEAPRSGAVQDVGGFLHLDHERRLPARDVVRCADARVDAIDDPDLRARRRHERSRPAPSGR